jgi:transcriptional regulator with XRE-family HTH domain
MQKNNITKLRNDLGLNQLKFARKLKKSQSWVSAIESGRILPSAAMAIKIIKLANNYGINISYESLRPLENKRGN